MSEQPLQDASTVHPDTRSASVTAARPVPTLTIIAHPDGRRVGAQAHLHGLLQGQKIELSRNQPAFVLPGQVLGASLGDPHISRKPLRLSGSETGDIRLRAPTDGTRVVIGEHILGRDGVELPASALARGVPVELAGRVALLLHHTTEVSSAAGSVDLDMVGSSAAIVSVRQAITRIGDLEVPVLIRGATGTGKELVARAIHQRGPRRAGPFISVNLGAIPRELAAAELFGARKGAFTGATSDRPGFFGAATDGTLFLDEVGEASLELQAMLLRVLETGEAYPVGGRAPLVVNARIVAATDADLEARIAAGSFKQPLLHRLAGYRIHVPPLGERPEDIAVLFYHFAHEQLRLLGQGRRLDPDDPYAEPFVPPGLAARLVRASWPGNIRQLKNVARQLVIENRDRPSLIVDAALAHELDVDAVAIDVRIPESTELAESAEPMETATAQVPHRRRRKPAGIDEDELRAALRASAWDLKAASDRLGVARSSMYDLIARFPAIRTAGDLSPDEIRQCHRACDGDLDAMVARLEVSRRALRRRLKELDLI